MFNKPWVVGVVTFLAVLFFLVFLTFPLGRNHPASVWILTYGFWPSIAAGIIAYFWKRHQVKKSKKKPPANP